MRARLLLAPAAAGKTQYCIDRIQQLRRGEPLASIWVILPDAAEVRAFRRRLALAGGAIGVQPVTFYVLYGELLAMAGQSVPRLDDPVLHRLLRAIVDELYAAGTLHHYAALRDKPGFFRALRFVIQELKRARVPAEAFAPAVKAWEPRLRELADVYDKYQQWLRSSEWADAEGQGWLAALALGADPDLCTDWRLLVVDGFDQFNPTQLEVLRRLAEQVQETLITLTGADPPRLAHRRFARARQAVESALGVSARPLPGARVRLSQPLAYLETALFEPFDAAQGRPFDTTQDEPALPGSQPFDGALTLLEAPTRAQEVRAALRWLKKQRIHNRLPLHQIAILARDLEPYRPFLEETAAEFGLPLTLAEGTWLDENPAVASLLDLLALPLRDWPRRLAVEAWRSPYFDWSTWGIGPADADQLDAVARHSQVIAGLDQWRDALERLAAAQPAAEEPDAAGEDSDDAASLMEVPRGEKAARLLARFNAFARRLTPPEPATFRSYTAWLEALIGDDPDLATGQQPWHPGDTVGIVARARRGPGGEHLPTAGRDVAALRRLKDVLRGLVFAESALGQPQPIPYERFWQELRGTVEATSYRVPAPENQGCVLAASVLAARGLSFRAVALLGLSEGQFPRTAQQDPLLRESDRQALREAGIELEQRLLGDEVTIFYEAVTRSTDRLLVTRPYLADDGQPWEPSPYWEQVRRLAGAQPQRVRPQDLLPPADAASQAELLSAVAHGLARPDQAPVVRENLQRLAEDPDLWSAWQSVQAGAQVLKARLADAAGGPHEGDLSDLREHLSRIYGAERPWSASRLETYAACPFAFFAAYALRLELRQPVEAGYDVRQLGSMYHAILEQVFRRSAQTGEAPADILPEIARRIFDTAPEKYAFRPTPLWARQREELERILAATVEALLEEAAGWEPAHFESPFGLHSAPPLELRGADGETLRLRGYIDRVDVNADGHLRVIDYKSGATSIADRDLEEGRRVQLALYALAAQEVLRMGRPVAGMYWHIGSAQPSRLKLEGYAGGIEAALNAAVAHALSYAAGARQGHFEPQPPDGGCPNWCPAADFCWRYAPKGW